MIDCKPQILIAEDECNLATSIHFVLAAAGYRITVAKDGDRAFRFIEHSYRDRACYDLLITDIRMPIMSGQTLIERLRLHGIDIPVLVITGFCEKDLLIGLMRLGCRDVLEKPFEPEDLEKHVRMILNKTRISRDANVNADQLSLMCERTRSLVHDLNNVLGGTLGYADMIREEIDTAHPAKKKVDKLFTTANLAATICRQLLKLNPREFGEEMVATELRTIIARIAAVLQAIAPETVEIETSTPAQAVWLKTDPERIQQAILNLGVNAIDAMRNGGTLKLILSVEKAMHPEEQVRTQCVSIAISDSGEGLSEQNLHRLFREPFTTKPDGHGIGLSTVKVIVEGHGGWIEVQSQQHHGTEFKLFFPQAKKT